MLDLLLGVTGMAVACLLAAVAGAKLQKQARWKSVLMALFAATGTMAGYMIWIWDRPLLIQVLPFSNAIILGNWLPVLGSFFVGVCLQTQTIVLLRRLMLGATLGCLCGYSLISPLLGSAPECQMTDSHERFLDFQTTPQTCSAACAAGLLRLHGIEATESELAELCLTRRGTHWLGLFRGLKIKTAGTEWDVVAEEIPPLDLISAEHVLGVLSLTFADQSAEHAIESGFATDVGHAVVCLGTTEWGTLEIFDPSPDYGFESWNDRILQDVESVILLRLVSRKGSPSPLQGVNVNRSCKWNERRLASR